MDEGKMKRVVREILRRMYQETLPKLDNPIEEFSETEEEAMYMRYYLPQEDQDKIMDEVISEEELEEREAYEVKKVVRLGAPSPNSSYDTWQEWVKEYEG